MFSRLSSKTIYRRFHLAYPRVPEQMLDLMLDVDHYDKESLIAVTEEEIVGHAMYVKLADSGDAEVAFVVEDEWQSKGVGKLLLAEIAEKARLRDVETFSGQVLGENRWVLGLLNAVFAGVECVMRHRLYHFRVPLETLKPTAPPVRLLRRVA
jgi:GNAT superfamily N-acetyltransferase